LTVDVTFLNDVIPKFCNIVGVFLLNGDTKNLFQIVLTFNPGVYNR